jgi:CRP/FNR family transcriptional regulator, dissimilatory nitrate respiration regulator
MAEGGHTRGDPSLGDMFPGPAQSEAVAAGTRLFRQGDPAAAVYYVESGRLRLERYTAAGTTVVLHTAHAGELLAEGALVAEAYHCDAVALEDSRVRVFRKATLLANLKPGSPGHALVAVMARQLLRLRQRLELRNVRAADERVMLYLAQNADRGGEVVIDRALQEIAGDLGLSREALYRTLAMLQKTRRIARRPGHIALLRR